MNASKTSLLGPEDAGFKGNVYNKTAGINKWTSIILTTELFVHDT